ncbi:spore coat protein [Selenomonadales bacterium OttesenSCG-928-I06]|nr:spore coat protein [Selenomonadales bacterium OttesenSCG-928-I06]
MAQQSNQTSQSSQQMSGQNTSLSDKDILQLSLTCFKHMASSINTFALESSDNTLRRDYLSVLGEVQGAGKQLFDLMNQKGFYNVKNATPQDINQTRSSFSQQLS